MWRHTVRELRVLAPETMNCRAVDAEQAGGARDTPCTLDRRTHAVYGQWHPAFRGGTAQVLEVVDAVVERQRVRAFSIDKDSLNGRIQLPDIVRPCRTLEGEYKRRRDHWRPRIAVVSSPRTDTLLDEYRNVCTPFAKRWQPDAKRREARLEIGKESGLAYKSIERDIRRGDYAHVNT